MRKTAFCAFAIAGLLAACSDDKGSATPATTAPATTAAVTTAPSTSGAPATTEPAKKRPAHVFVIMLENTDFDSSFGASSAAPYLANDLPSQGMLLTQYYGVAHVSLGNYIAQISGQAPNPSTQLDCFTYTEFVQTGTDDNGQALGDGCVYPTSVPNLADQMTASGLTWRAYAEDMAAGQAGEPTACRHPEIGGADGTMASRAGDAYATRHVPFLYFHSVIDSPDCAKNVVDLGNLETDLASEDTTPSLVYIVPNLCSDGHDQTCAKGGLGGMEAANAFLQEWVPKLQASPAFEDNGLLIVTFDEADVTSDATSCCGDLPSPNLTSPAGISGPGGGRVGAVLIGAAITPGSVNDNPYNHYSLLCSLENLWGLDKLGYAGNPATPCFGDDVYNADPGYATP
jgi:hypothetical protein